MLENFINYVNHFCAHIYLAGKHKFVIRYRAPTGQAGGAKENMCLDIKESLPDFKNFFSSLNIPIVKEGANGNTTTTLKNAGEVWFTHSKHLKFNNIVFDPRALEAKLSGDPDYDRYNDDYLNCYKGWAETRWKVAKLHWNLYYRKVRPWVDEGRVYADVRPLCGWYHLEFVDRSNFLEFPGANIGDLVTVYSALPGNPFAIGPPWKYNPYWPKHWRFIRKLEGYNLNYFYRIKPEGYDAIDDEDIPDEVEERKEFMLDLWFGRKDCPAASAGITCAPIFQWIWHCLALRNVETYNYLINWLATWRQMKTDAPDTCLVMRSEVGTGKSSFVSMLGTLVGSEYYHVSSDPEDILGYFTTNLGHKLLLFMDEVKIENNAMFNRFKQTLTAQTSRVRELHVGAKHVRKFFAMILASNLDNVLPADPGERRMLFLELPFALSNCRLYLSAFCNVMFGDGEFKACPRKLQMDKAGPGALLFAHRLDTWKIEGYYNGWPVPQNTTLAQHQIRSLNKVGLWWHDKLKRGQHISPTNLEDFDYQENHEVINRRYLLTIASVGLSRFKQLIRYNTAFSQKWYDRQPKTTIGDKETLDWQRMVDWLGEWPNKGPYQGRGNRISIFMALTKNDMAMSWKSRAKLTRAEFWCELYEANSKWVVYLPKQALFQYFKLENPSRGDEKTTINESAFWTRMEASYLKPNTDSAYQEAEISAMITVDPQWQFHGTNGGVGRPRKPKKSRISYITLPSLAVAREAFALSMNWETDLAENHWAEATPRRTESSINDPWMWFGDKKSRDYLTEKYEGRDEDEDDGSLG